VEWEHEGVETWDSFRRQRVEAVTQASHADIGGWWHDRARIAGRASLTLLQRSCFVPIRVAEEDQNEECEDELSEVSVSNARDHVAE
jgi:hypothetical protein